MIDTSLANQKFKYEAKIKIMIKEKITTIS
jgi:hypothetical protein